MVLGDTFLCLSSILTTASGILRYLSEVHLKVYIWVFWVDDMESAWRFEGSITGICSWGNKNTSIADSNTRNPTTLPFWVRSR